MSIRTDISKDMHTAQQSFQTFLKKSILLSIALLGFLTFSAFLHVSSALAAPSLRIVNGGTSFQPGQTVTVTIDSPEKGAIYDIWIEGNTNIHTVGGLSPTYTELVNVEGSGKSSGRICAQKEGLWTPSCPKTGDPMVIPITYVIPTAQSTLAVTGSNPVFTLNASNFQYQDQNAVFTIQNADPQKSYCVWVDGDQACQFVHNGGQTFYRRSFNVRGKPGETTETLCLSDGGIVGLPPEFDRDNIGGATNGGCTSRGRGWYLIYHVFPDIPTPGPTLGTEAGPTPLPTITPTPLPPPCADFQGGRCVSVRSAIGGTISTDPAGFIKDVMGVLLSVSGGIALLLILYSGYKMLVSTGNPEKVKDARDTLTSAIVGLLFIIFSLVILEVIGVDILHIPGFGH